MNGQIESKNVLQVNIGMDVIYVIMAKILHIY